MSPKEYPTYFDIKLNPTNREPNDDIGLIYNTVGETAGKMALKLRIEDLFKQMNLSGSDEDTAWTVLLEIMKDLNVQKKSNSSPNEMIDEMFNNMEKKAGSFFGGNVKKNHNRKHKTKRARKTRKSRRNKNKRYI